MTRPRRCGRSTGRSISAARLTTLLGTRGRPRLVLFTGSGEVDEAVKSAREGGEVEVVTWAEMVAG